eukprot:857512-Amorphochlora_amoeboformis.AAC.1
MKRNEESEGERDNGREVIREKRGVNEVREEKEANLEERRGAERKGEEREGEKEEKGERGERERERERERGKGR